jgi:hypothetical protein
LKDWLTFEGSPDVNDPSDAQPSRQGVRNATAECQFASSVRSRHGLLQADLLKWPVPG